MTAGRATAVTVDTIYALSSGSPPAAIAIVRISGPRAETALAALAGTLPPARRPVYRALKSPATGTILDRALIFRFPGPASATGEDVAELHLHGGRAVVAAVLGALAAIGGLREAGPGEFTRRAFEHGRIDLSEAEGLADLLEAETESQRRSALAMAGGALSRKIGHWQERLLALAARLEAMLDFSDQGEVGESMPQGWSDDLATLAEEMREMVARPGAERLREGVRIVIAGPPNAGKSSLLNYLSGRDAAITSAIAGTTRDLVEVPTQIAGKPFLLIDTAGLREVEDEVEAIGVRRAQDVVAAADLILWLGGSADCPDRARAILVQSKSDVSPPDPEAQVHVSAKTGEGMAGLVELMIDWARLLLPREGEIALNARHRHAIGSALAGVEEARGSEDFVVAAEGLRQARLALDLVTGSAGVENMLDALFGRFCVGK